MRKAVKFSFAYLLAVVTTFTVAKFVLPGQLATDQDHVLTAIFALLYFLVLPVLYWQWVIIAGNKKAWRIIIAFSLSSFAARYSFPHDIAVYFEFIAWLRYPFIAILLAIEFVLFFSIIRGLWQARHISGDPRLGIFSAYEDKKAEHLDLALAFSYEPASWYYAIPYLSRNHIKPLATLELRSGRVWFLVASVFGLLVASTLSYFALLPVNEILAIVISSFLAYGVIMATANYRVSRHYPIYVSGDNLVINNNFLNLLLINRKNIGSIVQGDWPKSKSDKVLSVGSGDRSNVEIKFGTPQTYYGLMGMVTEKVDAVRLSVFDPEDLVNRFSTELTDSNKGF